MFTIATTIERPPDEVFDFIANIGNSPRWFSAVTAVEPLSEGTVGEGARYRFERNLPSGAAANEVEVTEYTPRDAITLTSRTGPTPFSYRFSVAPDGPGARVTLQGEISGEGLGGVFGLLKGAAPALFERGMRANLEALKALLERG
jgi:uncharacterized protein YndB with AHSA1/START domain